MCNDIRIQLPPEVAGEEMPTEASALGAVFDIHGGDNDDKACREGWESHMWMCRETVPDNMTDFKPSAPVMIRESDSFCSDTQNKTRQNIFISYGSKADMTAKWTQSLIEWIA